MSEQAVFDALKYRIEVDEYGIVDTIIVLESGIERTGQQLNMPMEPNSGTRMANYIALMDLPL